MNASSSGGPVRAGRFAWLALAALALGGCATVGSGDGGGLVPTRAAQEAARTAAADTARRALAPEAVNPANAGADDVPVPAPVPVPEPGQVVGSTASGGHIVARHPAPAVVDSGPSPEARDVLATIPEPLAAGERVAPPAEVQQRYPARDATPGAGMRDSLAAAGAAAVTADSVAAGTGAVPVPEPTLPLGQRRPSAIPTLPDSVVHAVADSAAHAGGPAPAAPAAGTAPAGSRAPAAAPGATTAGGADSAAAAAPDTCWRVQVAAPEEADRAEQLRAAAASLLLVPMVVEKEQGLFKVRTRDCLNGATATRLRGRAEETGFKGAFRFVRKP